MLFAAILFSFFLINVLAFYLNRMRVPRKVWFLSFGAFSLRVGYVLLDELIGIYRGGGDQTMYDITFWFIAQQWRSGIIFAPLQYGASPGNNGYYMLLYSAMFSPSYVIFGHMTVLPRLQMALFGTLVVVNIYLIGGEMYNHHGGLIAGIIAAGFPYWIVLSGIIYRDMFVIFLLTTTAYYLVKWQSGKRTFSILGLIIGTSILALSLRIENAIAIGALFITTVFLSVGRNPRGYIITLVAGPVTLTVLYLRFGKQYLVSKLAHRRLWLARSNPGAYLSGFAYESFLELFVFAPIGAIYFTLVPFPWHTIDSMAIVAIGQNLLIWYPVLALSIIGLRDILHVNSGIDMLAPLLAFCLAGIFGYGLVEGNIGPAIRHRSQFQFIFFILAGIAISKRVRINWHNNCTEEI